MVIKRKALFYTRFSVFTKHALFTWHARLRKSCDICDDEASVAKVFDNNKEQFLRPPNGQKFMTLTEVKSGREIGCQLGGGAVINIHSCRERSWEIPFHRHKAGVVSNTLERLFSHSIVINRNYKMIVSTGYSAINIELEYQKKFCEQQDRVSCLSFV